MKDIIKTFITEKALNVFLNKGFEGAKMEEVAKESDISKPTLYKYFPSKMDLFLGVINLINKRIDEQLISVLESEDDYFKRMDMFLEKNLDFALKHKRFVKMAIFDSTSPFFKDKSKRNKYFKEFFKVRERRKDIIKKFIQEGIDKGIIRDDLSSCILTVFIIGLIKEFFFEIVMSKNDYDIDEVKKTLLNILNNGVFRR